MKSKISENNLFLLKIEDTTMKKRTERGREGMEEDVVVSSSGG